MIGLSEVKTTGDVNVKKWLLISVVTLLLGAISGGLFLVRKIEITSLPESYTFVGTTVVLSEAELLEECLLKAKRHIRSTGRTFVGAIGKTNVMAIMDPIYLGVEEKDNKSINKALSVIGAQIELRSGKLKRRDSLNKILLFLAAKPEFSSATNETSVQGIARGRRRPSVVEAAKVAGARDIEYYHSGFTNKVTLSTLQEISEIPELKYEVYSAVINDVDSPIELKYEVYSAVINDVDSPIELKYEVYNSVINDVDSPIELVYEVQYKILQDIVKISGLDWEELGYSRSYLARFCWSVLYVESKLAEESAETLQEEYAEAWVNAESELSLNSVEYKPIPGSLKGKKFVVEVVTANSDEEDSNQRAELEYLRTLGYNGFVVAYRGEDPTYLSDFVQEYKAKGWKIGLTYYVREGSSENQYKNFQVLEQAYSLLLPQCDFVLLTWRGSTGHHWNNQTLYKLFVTIMANLVRVIDEDMPILDSIQLSKDGSVLNDYIIENPSGLVVFNMGSIFNNNLGILKKRKIVNGIPLVFGATPYWTSEYSTRESKVDNMIYTRAKVRKLCGIVESDLLNGGVPFTITIMGNGLGSRYGNTDSLTESQWRVPD